MIARWWYGDPSRALTVIGVTGTHGKSSVVMLLGHVLTTVGLRAAWFSTATISDGPRTWLNAYKMTMPGRFTLQRYLRATVDHGCTVAIIETSSEGIAQYRHRGIAYDIAVLTNLGKEHLEAHGGFARYRAAKARLFAHTARQRSKRRIAIIPEALEQPEEFTKYPFTRVVRFAATDGDGRSFAPVLTAFPDNVAAVLAVVEALGLDRAAAIRALEEVRSLPGRLERIDDSQPYDVVVDYAHTPEALEAVYRALPKLTRRTIHVLGGVGGGRDRWKRPAMGAAAAAHADVVIVTNEDPYDDDPDAIIADVARGATEWIAAHDHGTLQKEVRTIRDRREALREALHVARPGDRILVTGKGCEQAIVGPHGSRVLWDDRVVLRELLSEGNRYEG